MSTLRTKEGQEKYREHIKDGGLDLCPLCKEKSIKEFKFWRVIPNNFPYDRIADVHNMLIPYRHIGEEDLSEEELEEFKIIKDAYLHKEYDWLFEATYKKKTIPSHFHLHLIIAK